MGKKKKLYKTTMVVDIFSEEIIDHQSVIDDFHETLELISVGHKAPFLVAYGTGTAKSSMKEVDEFFLVRGEVLKAKDIF